MKRRVVVLLIILLLLAPTLALAQDNTPGVGPLATAQAAQDEANAAKWRAQSAQATAQAGYALATQEVMQATEQARLQATATAAQATSQALATSQAIEATQTALAVRATEMAIDAQATREAIAATATLGAVQAQATIEAQAAALSDLEIEQRQQRNSFLGNVYLWVLIFGIVIGFVILWILSGRITLPAKLQEMFEPVEGDIIEGEVIPGARPQPTTLLLLPAVAGGGNGAGVWARQVVMRPKLDEQAIESVVERYPHLTRRTIKQILEDQFKPEAGSDALSKELWRLYQAACREFRMVDETAAHNADNPH